MAAGALSDASWLSARCAGLIDQLFSVHTPTDPSIYTRLSQLYAQCDAAGGDYAALAPSPTVNGCLQRLVSIARAEFGDVIDESGRFALTRALRERIATDAALLGRAQEIRAIAALAETELEYHYSALLSARLREHPHDDSAAPDPSRGRLHALRHALAPFPYIESYAQLIGAELRLLHACPTPLFLRERAAARLSVVERRELRALQLETEAFLTRCAAWPLRLHAPPSPQGAVGQRSETTTSRRPRGACGCAQPAQTSQPTAPAVAGDGGRVQPQTSPAVAGDGGRIQLAHDPHPEVAQAKSGLYRAEASAADAWRNRVLAICGCGPLPISGLMLHAATGAALVLIDESQRALDGARELVDALAARGLLERRSIQFRLGDAAALRYGRGLPPHLDNVECDAVIVASLIPQPAKLRLAQALRAFATSTPLALIVRSAGGLCADLIYERVPTEQLGLPPLVFCGESVPRHQVFESLPAASAAGGEWSALGSRELLAIADPQVLNSSELYYRLPRLQAAGVPPARPWSARYLEQVRQMLRA